jgi:hypothetical protein
LKEAARKERRLNPEEVGPLLPSQYNLPAGAAPRSRPVSKPSGSIEESSRPMSPYELGSKNPISSIWASKEEYATFTGEPPRGSLTEPPAGYRTPSPTIRHLATEVGAADRRPKSARPMRRVTGLPESATALPTAIGVRPCRRIIAVKTSRECLARPHWPTA